MNDNEWRYREKTVLKSVRVLAIVCALGLAAISRAAEPSCPRVEVTLVEPGPSSETRPVKRGNQTIFVLRNAITTSSDITEIKVTGDAFETSIQIRYTPAAAARLLSATTDHDGLKMAFVVDDEVWLAFTWQGPYGIGPDGTQLTLRPGLTRAKRESIRGCADKRTL